MGCLHPHLSPPPHDLLVRILLSSVLCCGVFNQQRLPSVRHHKWASIPENVIWRTRCNKLRFRLSAKMLEMFGYLSPSNFSYHKNQMDLCSELIYNLHEDVWLCTHLLCCRNHELLVWGFRFSGGGIIAGKHGGADAVQWE